MAFPLNNMIFLLAFFFLLNESPFVRTIATSLDDVCRRSLDLAFFLADFGSNPITRMASLPLLAHIAIDRAGVNATAARAKIHLLFHTTMDPRIKALLGQCGNSYTEALNVIGKATDDLDHRNYWQAFDAAERCENLFKSPLKSPVTIENQNFGLICDIIGIIADELSSGRKRKLA
ncbi:hypothetical protein CDL12_22253 [Handroanthus impetiginosus]|uniref:Uncharacterized protein n=1 Tax=Handroanthus impetiginosus TaxID=429701 RepID=A0A2G9GIX4_9LAMI|nr:hypothetical protein CDL12_22253 [Handroanthus impetiginosus]